MEGKKNKYDLLIIGAGPAGLTASIYASRFGIKHLIIGSLIEGRMAEADKVGNFPTEQDINGKDLVKKMETHAKDFGVEIKMDKVEKIEKAGENFLVKTIIGQEYYAQTLLLAFGAERIKLNVPGEKEFFGKGVSYCATCDGKFFSGKTVAVVGGSSAAATTAAYLAGITEKTYLIHSGEKLTADKVWQKRVEENPKIEIILNNKIKELKGEGVLEKAYLENEYNGKKELALDGVFVEMGIAPDLGIIQDLGIEKDEKGFIKIKSNGSTSVEGIWAAGDITDGSNNLRQIITACSEGAIGAAGIFKFLQEK